MWGNHVAWRVKSNRRELHTITQGRGQLSNCCQNKSMFPRITVHSGLQVCRVVWSADLLFPLKQEEPNECK